MKVLLSHKMSDLEVRNLLKLAESIGEVMY